MRIQKTNDGWLIIVHFPRFVWGRFSTLGRREYLHGATLEDALREIAKAVEKWKQEKGRDLPREWDF